ncbi:MAG TPA: recombination protein RecR [Bacteroidales bacterium]|nr:recombination protein RecR [Bacteroidales bacterium]
MTEYSSKLLEQAVDRLSRLPGIGRKTALRLCLHILKSENGEAKQLGEALMRLRDEVCYCKTCHNIADSDLCQICANPRREAELICVVEDIRDVMAIENTSQFKGRYHVLGGIISPIEGIGPSDLNIDSLIQRVQTEKIREIVMALPATIEGDTTIFYIYKKVKDSGVLVTTIARGVAVGDDLEFADEVTLGRSILNRVPFEGLTGK